MALTKKQRLFVDEYLIDLNATQAAIRAGYSTRRATEIDINCSSGRRLPRPSRPPWPSVRGAPRSRLTT